VRLTTAQTDPRQRWSVLSWWVVQLELISERTKSALAAARKRGVRLGTRNPDRQVKLMMEGYRRENESFVSKVRPIIEEIRSAGVSSLKGIAECLTRRGIPTRTGKSVWWGSSVKCVLG
jgi:DNA invertase Pin-like site-specific DNA recombinase